jgi:hypothetical protein
LLKSISGCVIEESAAQAGHHFLEGPLAMMKIGWLATSVFCVGIFACAKPTPLTPTSADATKGMSVCWKSIEESSSAAPSSDATTTTTTTATTTGDESLKLRRAIGERLESAGYTLVAKDCDLRLAWAYTTATRNEGSDFRSISVTIKARKEDRILDLVKLHLDPDAAPIDQPDRVAIPVVNAMNASPRLATYAKEHPRGSASSSPVSTTTTTSATLSTKRAGTTTTPGTTAAKSKKPPPQAGSNGQTWSFSDDVEDMENSLSPESAQ